MFKYFGAKYKLGHAYPPPDYRVIVEPFAGAASFAVLHRKCADRVVLVEKDARVAELWHRLIETSREDLICLPDPEVGGVSDDLLVAFAAGRTTRDTPPRFVVSPRMAQRFRPMISRMATVIDECRHFEVSEGDYTSAPDVEATWFVDPPYQAQGGRWDRTRGGRYRHPNIDIDYRALGDWCQERRGQVIVCEQAGADWMTWNGGMAARDNTHEVYGEVWWHSGGDDGADLLTLLAESS